MDEKKNDLEFQLLKLTLGLYNNPLIPRKVVQFFIDALILIIFDIIFPVITERLKTLNNDNVLDEVNQISRACKEIFDKFKSETDGCKLIKTKA